MGGLGAEASASASGSTLRNQFDLFDANGEGTLDPKELQALCAALGAPLNGPDELNAAMQELDKDRSGRIEFDEFQKWFNPARGH